jgi:hypothetical protein
MYNVGVISAAPCTFSLGSGHNGRNASWKKKVEKKKKFLEIDYLYLAPVCQQTSVFNL